MSGRHVTGGTRRHDHPTPLQARILRYWAPATVDQADWLTGRPAPPEIPARTYAIMFEAGWLLSHPPLLIVTDAGRAAIRMQAVHRDRRCTVPACNARPGERCLHLGVRTDRVHAERNPAHRRSGLPADGAGPRRTPAGLVPAYDPNMPVGFIIAT